MSVVEPGDGVRLQTWLGWSANGVMPSHLSSIGFPLERPEELGELADRVGPNASALAVKKGRYFRWTGSGGEELWLQVNAHGELIGINPHFDGQSRIRVGVTTRVSRKRDTELDGAFHAWASPGEEPTDGAYPFIFDTPDAASYLDLEVPSIVEAQITAFAHELSLFDSEEEQAAAETGGGLKLASRSFIPSGLFSDKEHQGAEPAAEAVFTGQILQVESRANELTGKPFLWALVDTLGGQFDVVADPVLVERDPVVGGFLSGSFWLSGRLITYPRKKKSWFGQLLGGSG